MLTLYYNLVFREAKKKCETTLTSGTLSGCKLVDLFSCSLGFLDHSKNECVELTDAEKLESEFIGDSKSCSCSEPLCNKKSHKSPLMSFVSLYATGGLSYTIFCLFVSSFRYFCSCSWSTSFTFRALICNQFQNSPVRVRFSLY